MCMQRIKKQAGHAGTTQKILYLVFMQQGQGQKDYLFFSDQKELKCLTLLAFRFPCGFRVSLTVNGNERPFHRRFRSGFRGRFEMDRHAQLIVVLLCVVWCVC